MIWRHFKGILVLIVGILFIMMGLVGSILPFVPGWIFSIMGVLLLSLYFPRLRAWLDSHTERWPKVHAYIHRMRMWADRNIGKL